MATETGTVELPSETTETEDSLVEAIGALIEDAPESPQKSEEQETVSEEQPPQETETTSETESETPPAAETEDEELALPPEIQESVNKRMAKLTAKRKEAEEQLAKIQAERDELEGKVKELAEATKETQPTPPESDPLLRVPEINKIWQKEQDIEGKRNQAAQLLRESKSNPDSVLERMQKGMPQQGFQDIEQVRDFLESVKETARDRLSELRTQRGIASERHIQKMEKEGEKYHEQATKAYPDALDKKSKLGLRVAELAKRMPALLDPKIVPDGWLIITDLAAGQLQREAKAAAPAVAKAPPPKLPVPGKATSTASVTRATGKPAATALKQKAVESGSFEDIDRALEAILE